MKATSFFGTRCIFALEDNWKAGSVKNARAVKHEEKDASASEIMKSGKTLIV